MEVSNMLNLLTALATTAIILGKDEQIQLVREAQDTADNDARHNLVQANIRLAHKVAKKHVRKGLDFNDLLAQATEGILIAIDKFDVTKGASFAQARSCGADCKRLARPSVSTRNPPNSLRIWALTWKTWKRA